MANIFVNYSKSLALFSALDKFKVNKGDRRL